MSKVHYVEVEVDLGDFDSDDLIEVLQGRGYAVTKTTPDLTDHWIKLAEAFRYSQNPEDVARDLIYQNTGRIV